EALRRLDHAVRHDDLTGVLARRAFMRQGERLLARYGRETSGVAVLRLDVDHVKQVNDQHGHGAGDQLLIGIASTMASTLRAQDVLGRMGGEEFAVV
ncbi:GGDEF domain-containing protein, partial [Acinetobacter baumannii]